MGPILSSHATVKYATDTAVIVFHGNSLVYGQSGATVPQGAMPYQVQRLAPVGNAVTCNNRGANGQSWAGMRTTGAQVDALYESGKKNILVCWEGHNSQFGEGKTPAQAFADAQAYCADRLTAKPGWLIVHMTTIPAFYQSWTDSQSAAGNANLNEYNRLLTEGWRGTGAKSLVDVRQTGSPFILGNFNRTTFAAALYGGQSIWSPNDQQGGGGTGQNQFVHCSDVGYGYLAQIVANALRRLPTR